MYTVAGGISSGVEAGAAIGFAILGMTIVGVPALVLLFLYCYHRRNDGYYYSSIVLCTTLYMRVVHFTCTLYYSFKLMTHTCKHDIAPK